jgi:hypothetical protein
MHDCDDSPRRFRTPAEEEEREQEAILDHLLCEHPDQLTVAELIREFARDEVDAQYVMRIEHNVVELIGAGLLRRDGETIRPTRAALRFHRLHESD